MTIPPNALDPYKLEEAPLIISILSMSVTDILFKSNDPKDLPIIGNPSTSIVIYEASNPCICNPSVPVFVGTLIIPVCIFITSYNLLALDNIISFSEIIVVGIGNLSKSLSDIVAEIIISSNSDNIKLVSVSV